MQASKEGDAESVEMLLKKGCNTKYRDKDGNTPLHLAALNGRVDVVELLISHGADVNARDNYGWTPLHSAAYNGHAGVAELLIRHGADLNAKNSENKTPLDVARERGQNEVARIIEEFIASRQAILDVEAPELYAGKWDARAFCPACGDKLVFIKTLNRYYCFKCKDYR
jgi:ankyrin repeat protein